jgi:DNA-binding SARP family transcriptional activator/Tfp pilus assembly protein PilF
VLFRFLDIPHLELEKQDERLHSTKPIALLIYLACQHDFVSREALTVLFNEDSSDTDALRQVRVLLSRARKFSWASGLKLEQNRLRFVTQTDVQMFRAAIGAADWQRATELYKSEFLTGFRVGAQGFEAWLETEREVLRTAWLDAALKHARALGSEGQHQQASILLEKVLATDELCEDVLTAYLEHCYLAGMRNEALNAFKRFQDQLSTELGLEPLQSSLKLIQTIRLSAPLEIARDSRPDKLSVPISVLRPPKIIGRDSERYALETASEQVILVSGEPGAGKTRLLEEVMPRTSWLNCLEGMENLPYQPLIAFLRQHLEQLPDLGVYTEDLARLIPELLPNTSIRSDDPISAKSRTLEALARCFEAQQNPFVIDDLQWADSPSLEFCNFLVSRGRVRIYGIYRSSEVSPALAKTISAWRSGSTLREIKLEPLKPEHVNTLLASLTGIEVGPPRFSAWLSRTSGGNPFFALETLKALFETDLLQEKDGIWQSQLDDISFDYNELRVPTKVATVIEQRISRLSEAARRALQAASVMRQGFQPKMLSSIIGLSEFATLDALEEAQNSSLIASDFFLHDLIRQGVYQNIPDARRTFLHGKVAQILENVAELLIVAEHWFLAGDVSRASQFWLESIRDLSQRDLCHEALKVADRALLLVLDLPLLEQFRLRKAQLLVELGDYLIAIDTAKGVLETNDPDTQSLAVAALASALFQIGKIEEAQKTIDDHPECVDLIENEALSKNLLMIRTSLAHAQGKYDQAAALLEPHLKRLRQQHPPNVDLISVLLSLGAIYDVKKQNEQALQLHREALKLSKQLGARHLNVQAAINHLYCCWILGRLEEGMADAEHALELGEFGSTSTLRYNLSTACKQLEQYPRAIELLEQELVIGQRIRIKPSILAKLSELYQLTGQSDRIEQTISKAITALESVDEANAWAMVIMSTLQRGTLQQQEMIKPYLAKLPWQSVTPNLRTQLEKLMTEQSKSAD